MRNTPQDFVLRVLKIFSFDYTDLVWWRTDGEWAPVTFFTCCNDFFAWALADAQEITPDNIGVLEQAIRDVASAAPEAGILTDEYDSLFHATLLFCARIAKSRPQGAYYAYLPEWSWDLFDACGPKREISFTNPQPHPRDPPASPTG